MTLSDTTNDLSSLLRFFRVRLPTSGMLSHSSSVTTARPRFKSANCCWILGRSARCLASSSSSRASLQPRVCQTRPRWLGMVVWRGRGGVNSEPRTFGPAASRPCSCPPVRRSYRPLHRPPRMLFQRRDRTHYQDPGTAPGRRPALRLVSPGPPYGFVQDSMFKRATNR